ncbi:arylamine N-acetyltransferase family protein [Microbulbifer thermotolerans]|uniref:Arylamine N-acetyltransferase n=1 Tax=Microbulbifer thermotolerans TaxID=252514 RepID=A0AB35HTB2_MICTH|nr:arylamine N-acetyltransferase [Microbulbifer thermotolerans]MCX2779383.1 arylamine N-acetyltransferase [Microbulbifer thermotolerans]MCX2800566.1 arylamine N-acetyltransferase [Microbulbifer thermotolerans]MCX2805715.1 arylamine N-acetyltransferase [Microbulbifer thermotolerans]MCX2831190.1 arylamine N-acetyltransferase [Microbulbifer thermotolerans]MCX2840085.1 arylamine N-acetyltransferase [Microbulbifer thermotolerans]
MKHTAIDMEAYFARIGYTGESVAVPETVRALVSCHVRSIPFENIDPFLGRPVAIDLPSVEHKLVRGGRGGYCFEQNTLLRAVLTEMGLHVKGLAARVLWQAPENCRPPQTHMILCSKIGGVPHLIDVGFGARTPTAPLRLDTEGEQVCSHGVYRLLRIGEDFVLQMQIDGQWLPLYRFDLQRQTQEDYKVFNWYSSTYPESQFVRELIAARAHDRGRHTLRGRELRSYPHQGAGSISMLANPRELCEVLADVFGIRLPAGQQVTHAFAALFARGESA